MENNLLLNYQAAIGQFKVTLDDEYVLEDWLVRSLVRSLVRAEF